MVHGDQAEEVIICFGYRLARPVLVRRTHFEFFVTPPELHLGPFSTGWYRRRPILPQLSYGGEHNVT
jgi:hypothetical protein